MELELKQWFVDRNNLGSKYVIGEIEKQTNKAILFSGQALIKPSNVCCKCGRILTDPVSIQLGIGPYCAGIDLRDTVSQEEKDTFIKEFSKMHPIKTWIPKSVIVNNWEDLIETTEEQCVMSEPQKPEIQAILYEDWILVKSDYKYAELCKSIPAGKWNKEKKFWYYPKTSASAHNIVQAFSSVENKSIDEEILLMSNYMDKAREVLNKELPDYPSKTMPWKHQKQAYYFAKNLSGAGLLMSMGTGKSKTLVDLILNSDDKKVLIICPNTVVRVWPKEFAKHSNGEFVVVPCEVPGKRISVDDKAAIAKTAYEENDKVVIVVNYESAWRNSMGEFIKSVKWDRICLDESHRVKQHDGKIGTFVGTLKADRKNILTGTPIPNSPLDIFSQYRFLDSGVFGTNFYRFRNRYARMGGYMNKQVVGFKNQEEMQEKIYSVAFRVEKDVLDLPEVQHIVRDFDMNEEAWKYYKQARDSMYVLLGEDRVNTDMVITQLLRMQQITSGYLPIMEEYEDENGKVKQRLLRVEKIDSGKAELLEELLEDINEPVIVFCRFRHDLDEIKSAAEKLGKKYGEISGNSKSALSDKAELKDDIDVAGVQIQAGGVGIDLSKARYGIYYSVGYSLGDYEQSLSRIHRPGQTKPVIYYHLVAANTVDELVYSNLKNKQDIVRTLMETKKVI